ncbi:MAG: pyridoxamine 5'-phosphate oxidase family protein [Deltaproteobacteria bacterium]|nr:MAG: pyridoxamine 5'-phosphate oxidase family protein [Deltaproteobacteria bacterium]
MLSEELAKDKLTPEAEKSFARPMLPKFLATVSAEGTVNIVPVISLEAADAGTLIFAELMIWKTRRNLEENPRVAAAVMTRDPRVWVAKGDFEGFQKKGKYYERLSGSELFRYNAYTGIRSAGVIRIREVLQVSMPKLKLIGDLIKTRILSLRTGSQFQGKGEIPVPVREKFRRLMAAKFLAYPDTDGYPGIIPLMPLFPADGRRLVFGTSISSGVIDKLKTSVRIAASVITSEPVAYQVKGSFQGIRRYWGVKVGVIEVDEIYSACPPLPGERIDMEE